VILLVTRAWASAAWLPEAGMIVMDGEEFLTAQEACAILTIKPATLYAYVSRGLLGSYRQGIKRTRLYRRAEVERLTRLRGPEEKADLEGLEELEGPEAAAADGADADGAQNESGDEPPDTRAWIPYV
jgi:citrate synthase